MADFISHGFRRVMSHSKFHMVDSFHHDKVRREPFGALSGFAEEYFRGGRMILVGLITQSD